MSKESIKLDSIRRLASLTPVLRKRNKFIRAIRDFFEKEDFLEIETPIILDSPLPEPHIEAISCEKGFLRTSHEPILKACLSAGYEKIFEIGPCFRKEELGRLHREEFTMLEWYQSGASSEDIIPFIKKLILFTAKKTINDTKLIYNGEKIELNSNWEILSIKDIFAKFAGRKIDDSIKENQFEMDLIEKIEANLPKNKPCILKDYPAEFRAYAKLSKDDPKFADRWELYIGGVEIANTYSELNDSCEIRKIIQESNHKRNSLRMKTYQKCRIFDDALTTGIPVSAGSALGIDRLFMILMGASSIEDVKI